MLHARGDSTDDLYSLAQGPLAISTLYKGYIVNGFRFHTREREECRKTQNSGVLSRGDNSSLDKEYYGTLIDIFALHYVGGKRVTLFKCDWYDVQHRDIGYKVNQYGLTMVNARRRLKTNEPFILACQAEQVFYIEDPKESSWLAVLKNQPRDFYNMPEASNEDTVGSILMDDEDIAYQQEEYDNYGRTLRPLDDDNEIAALNRNDIIPEQVPSNIAQQVQEQMMDRREAEDDFITDNDESEMDEDTSDEGTSDEMSDA